MMKKVINTCILSLCCLMSLPALAQVHRVTTVNPLSPGKTQYIDVYEYDYVDVRPQFPGGERGLINFINQTREYPYDAYVNRVEGRVLCSFIVHPDGSLSHIEVLRGAGDETLNREALRVIGEMPRWQPGKIGNSRVAVRCVLPIPFRL